MRDSGKSLKVSVDYEPCNLGFQIRLIWTIGQENFGKINRFTFKKPEYFYEFLAGAHCCLSY